MVPELNGVDHIHVSVRDRAAAARWYRDVLGFETVEALLPWAGKTGPLTIENREGSVHLALFERAEPTLTSALAMRTSGSGFLAWKAQLEDRGLELRITDHDLAWSLYFSDPDGNAHEITTYDHAWVRERIGSASNGIRRTTPR